MAYSSDPEEIIYDPLIHGSRMLDSSPHHIDTDPQFGLVLIEFFTEFLLGFAFGFTEGFIRAGGRLPDGFLRFFSVLLIPLAIVVFVARIMLLRIVLKDARSRGLHGIEMVWTFIVININGAVGWWVYSMSRPLGPLVSCPVCYCPRLIGSPSCPHCLTPRPTSC